MLYKVNFNKGGVNMMYLEKLKTKRLNLEKQRDEYIQLIRDVNAKLAFIDELIEEESQELQPVAENNEYVNTLD